MRNRAALALLAWLPLVSAGQEPKPLNLIPHPQHVESAGQDLRLEESRPVTLEVGDPCDPKIALAARILKEELEGRKAGRKAPVRIGARADGGDFVIRLADSSRVRVNPQDEPVLAHPSGQAYVLRTGEAGEVSLLGRPQGVLNGAMTLLQLLREEAGGLRIPGVYIRDYPDFEIRAAADFLLNGECNRWSLDRGQGWAAFEALARRKLDQCLRFKINAVPFDGFGWGLKPRPPEYPGVMRRLTAYARARGIHLVFGGYGAGYGMAFQKGPLYEGAPYVGEVFYNRESYPDGPTYACMKEPREKSVRKGVDTSILGTCRGNDELNRMKSDELKEFVKAVEPGALYIHHEDFGGFDTTAASWKFRCDRCRKRWPSDEAGPLDGAAGGLAHGYSCLIQAVNEVKNPETGYDAARDCLVFLTSPVYLPSSSSPEGWANCLKLWQSIGRLLPRAPNAVACFREIFPEGSGRGRWPDRFNQAMREAGADLGAMIFSIVGGDHWLSDYPFTAGPAYNAAFLGARVIFIDNGDSYQEPQQLLNAEYGWNVRSTGFYKDPRTGPEGRELLRTLSSNEQPPEEIFGDQGFLRRACERLYGASAAPPMIKYYREGASLSPAGQRGPYLPMAWNKLYASPVFWRALVLDSNTWGPELKSESYAESVRRMGLGRGELHRRLREQWETKGRMLGKGEELLKAALEASPLESSREDLRFLLSSTRTGILLSQALAHFHAFMEGKAQGSPDRQRLITARGHASAALTMAEETFPQPVDPSGGEVGSLKTQLRSLGTAMERLLE